MKIEHYSDCFEENQFLLRSIAGVYFKEQRCSKKLSLGNVSKLLHLNKGFLSDLERGNRHFPDGIINQLNALYSCKFDDKYSLRDEAIKTLSLAYTFLFYRQSQKEIVTLLNAISEKSRKENSYAFLTYKILELFYYIRVSKDANKVNDCKNMIENNIGALSNYEKSVFYSLMAIFYKRYNSKIILANKYLQQSNQFCNEGTIVHAMNLFQKIVVLGEMNRPALALIECQKAKDILKNLENYKRLTDIDLFEGNCLILLGEQEKAQLRLKSILELRNNELCDNTSSIIQSLAFSLIIEGRYQECIDIIEPKLYDLPTDAQWFLPFCLYKLNKIQECEKSIKDTLKNATETNSHFLLAIQYRIDMNDKKFVEECKYYYHRILYGLYYDNVPIILNFLLNFSEEKGDEALQLKVLSDLNKYHEKGLDLENSELL